MDHQGCLELNGKFLSEAMIFFEYFVAWPCGQMDTYCHFLARFGFSDIEVLLSHGHHQTRRVRFAEVLGNHLLALLDLTQDAIRPNARLDVADLLTQALGVSMPRRSDFMAGRTARVFTRIPDTCRCWNMHYFFRHIYGRNFTDVLLPQLVTVSILQVNNFLVHIFRAVFPDRAWIEIA